MIYGIGIDIVKNERIKNAVDKWGDKFLKRIFTDKELDYCFSKYQPYVSLAARFAAKEALIKAVSSISLISLKEIEVIQDKNGKPLLNFHNRIKEIIQNLSIANNHLSLSHEQEYSIAMVILEK